MTEQARLRFSDGEGGGLDVWVGGLGGLSPVSVPQKVTGKCPQVPQVQWDHRVKSKVYYLTIRPLYFRLYGGRVQPCLCDWAYKRSRATY